MGGLHSEFGSVSQEPGDSFFLMIDKSVTTDVYDHSFYLTISEFVYIVIVRGDR